MPHYKNGTEAKVGDIVCGKGYNVKNADGNFKEIVGHVVHVTPGADACNIQVAHVIVDELPEGMKGYHAHFAPKDGVIVNGAGTHAIKANVEYGACKDFEKIV